MQWLRPSWPTMLERLRCKFQWPPYFDSSWWLGAICFHGVGVARMERTRGLHCSPPASFCHLPPYWSLFPPIHWHARNAPNTCPCRHCQSYHQHQQHRHPHHHSHLAWNIVGGLCTLAPIATRGALCTITCNYIGKMHAHTHTHIYIL